jgi:hypothetical protein
MVVHSKAIMSKIPKRVSNQLFEVFVKFEVRLSIR